MERPLSSYLIGHFIPKHCVHNISVVHVDGGKGGIRAPVTLAYSLSRGSKCGYLSGENGTVYVVGV